jgi:hypothetical protein
MEATPFTTVPKNHAHVCTVQNLNSNALSAPYFVGGVTHEKLLLIMDNLGVIVSYRV